MYFPIASLMAFSLAIFATEPTFHLETRCNPGLLWPRNDASCPSGSPISRSVHGQAVFRRVIFDTNENEVAHHLTARNLDGPVPHPSELKSRDIPRKAPPHKVTRRMNAKKRPPPDPSKNSLIALVDSGRIYHEYSENQNGDRILHGKKAIHGRVQWTSIRGVANREFNPRRPPTPQAISSSASQQASPGAASSSTSGASLELESPLGAHRLASPQASQQDGCGPGKFWWAANRWISTFCGGAE